MHLFPSSLPRAGQFKWFPLPAISHPIMLAIPIKNFQISQAKFNGLFTRYFKTWSFFDPTLPIVGTSQCAFIKYREVAGTGMPAFACSFIRDIFHTTLLLASVQESPMCQPWLEREYITFLTKYFQKLLISILYIYMAHLKQTHCPLKEDGEA